MLKFHEGILKHINITYGFILHLVNVHCTLYNVHCAFTFVMRIRKFIFYVIIKFDWGLFNNCLF